MPNLVCDRSPKLIFKFLKPAINILGFVTGSVPSSFQRSHGVIWLDNFAMQNNRGKHWSTNKLI